MELAQMLNVQKGVTAVIGSGGKTSLIFALAQELSANARVIVCTTTKIFPPEMPCVTDEKIEAALCKHNLICVGTPTDAGKLSAPQTECSELARLADYVLVEADGAKRMPLKAHAAYEPVVPQEAGEVICVVGLSGIGKPISACVHRAEIFAQNLGAELDEIATAQLVCKHLKLENLHTRVFLNQADTEREEEFGHIIAKDLGCSVCMGALEKGWAVCLY
ncbi:MAG: putative selenium-dependent hydroxylase accessory protein YqeC [Oscillospiraceae bacterium]|nr:putative selenium-dependent hydroxylase accessory protein YqeC [Oscillospiraceae bacterium]